jgi:hypothetical protein
MPKPNDGDVLTPEQVASSLNASSFPGCVIDKDWHIGQFESWALQFGYPDGMPIYGGIIFQDVRYHVYYLNDQHQVPLIMGNGQTPQEWDVFPMH